MATQKKEITRAWEQIASAQPCVLQNRSLSIIEVATIATDTIADKNINGFYVYPNQAFAYNWSVDNVWVRAVNSDTATIIVDIKEE